MDFKNLAMTASAGMQMTSGTVTRKTSAVEPDFEALFAKLKEEACKTPEERARDKVLKKNDLDEAGYNALPADRRKAIDMAIAEEVRRVTEQRRAQATVRQGLYA